MELDKCCDRFNAEVCVRVCVLDKWTYSVHFQWWILIGVCLSHTETESGRFKELLLLIFDTDFLCVCVCVCASFFVHSVSGCGESLVLLESWNWRGCVETSVEEHSCLGLLCTASPPPPHPPPPLLLLLLPLHLCLYFPLSFSLALSHIQLLPLDHSVLLNSKNASPLCLLTLSLFFLSVLS